MPPSPETVICPRCHEPATRRPFAPEEREMMPKAVGDVFEINCLRCGRYECQLPVGGWTDDAIALD